MNNKFEFNNTLDSFVNHLVEQSKNAKKMVDYSKYDLMLEVAFNLKNLISKTETQGEINIDVDDVFNLGYVTTDIADLSVCEINEFIKIVEKADNFEIYPLTNGKIRFDITFQCVLKQIGKGTQ